MTLLRGRGVLPVALLVVLVVALLLSSQATRRPPRLEAVSPTAAAPGEVIVLTGYSFGEERGNSRVVIGGNAPATSAYMHWADRRIEVRVPVSAHSGLVYVEAATGRSEGALFTNRNELPIVVDLPTLPGEPFIREVDHVEVAVGTTITILGKNFGPEQGSSRVLFTWLAGDEAGYVQRPDVENMLIASDLDLDYASWSDTEIRVRVPDGAATGNALVQSDKGVSNAVFLEVVGTVGTKTFTERRTYSVEQTVTVTRISANGATRLYLWVPPLLQGPQQRNIRLTEEHPEPLYRDVAGLQVFQFSNLVTGGLYEVSQHYILDRYGVETVIRADRVKSNYDVDSAFYRRFTQAAPFLPVDEERVRALSRTAVGRASNAYVNARRIYDFVRTIFEVSDRPPEALRDAAAVLETSGSASSRDYALAFVALARAAGIPTRPVAGYLVDDALTARTHYWAEFFLIDFGWVPVDAFLGDRSPLVRLDGTPDPAAYYFGNLDNRHLATSRDVAVTSQLASEGQSVLRPAAGGLQDRHEEFVGNLSYEARWAGLTVVGVY